MFVDKYLDEAPHPQEPLLTGKRRGTIENRFWAKLIDFGVIMLILQATHWFLGSAWIFVLSPLLWAGVELANNGQSPGKWLLGLHVVDSLGAASPSFYGCFVRNLPFVVLSLSVFYFDSIIGFAGVILSIIFLVMESYFVLLIQSGLRLGDVLSTTRVQDYRDQHMRFIEQYLKDDSE